ncbi:MAG: hypothetical protein WCO42_09675 [bacterium]
MFATHHSFLQGEVAGDFVKRGSILILALWVIFMLAVLAVAVGAHVEGRLALARRIEQRTIGYYAVRTGVERGIAKLLQDTNGWDGLGESWSDNRADFSNVVSGAGAFSLVYSVERADGGSNVMFGLWDEQGKIDLNKGRIELMASLLEVAGGLSAEQAARLADAVNTARTRLVEKSPQIGAKTGWVDSRIEAGPLKSVDELRWIKGMSPEVFDKIRDHVTVYGGRSVNLNTADRLVLLSLAKRAGGGTSKAIENFVRKILQFRERGGIFKSLGTGLAEALGEKTGLAEDERPLLYGMAPYVTVTSSHFRGHAEGWLASGRASESRRIDFVWNRKDRRIEFWHED